MFDLKQKLPIFGTPAEYILLVRVGDVPYREAAQIGEYYSETGLFHGTLCIQMYSPIHLDNSITMCNDVAMRTL